MKKKYFVKYKEESVNADDSVFYLQKTRFFTTDDLAHEWCVFKQLCENDVNIIDVVVL